MVKKDHNSYKSVNLCNVTMQVLASPVIQLEIVGLAKADFLSMIVLRILKKLLNITNKVDNIGKISKTSLNL